ncbi:MAG: UbiA family prenyltransferase, partial [Vicinamibacteria bacterium]
MDVRHLLTLIKVRITSLVTLTAMAGYGLAPNHAPEEQWVTRFVSVTLGVFLITAGASAVNMFIERRTDALMDRTRARPLPMNILSPGQALAIGVVTSL